jgi:hypothetical protein
MTRSYGDAEPAFDFDKNVACTHERAQQAIQDQALLEGRIMNAKSPCGPSRKSDNVRFRAAVGGQADIGCAAIELADS